MLQLASGPTEGQNRLSLSSTIRLSNHLTWEILNFDLDGDARGPTANRLFDSSLSSPSRKGRDSPDLEVWVSNSPEVVVNTYDGGQTTRTGSSHTYLSTTNNGISGPWSNRSVVTSPENTLGNDALRLWTDHSLRLEDLNPYLVDACNNDLGSSSWWDLGNF